MQKVEMWWLREGREFLSGRSNLTATSLWADKHNTSHSPEWDAIAILPPIEGPFETIEEWVETEPPPITGDDYKQFAVFEEYSFWPVPRDEDSGPTIPERHEDALGFYGLAHRLNAVAGAADAPSGANPYKDPVNWGIGFFIAVMGAVAAALAVNLGGIV